MQPQEGSKPQLGSQQPHPLCERRNRPPIFSIIRQRGAQQLSLHPQLGSTAQQLGSGAQHEGSGAQQVGSQHPPLWRLKRPRTRSSTQQRRADPQGSQQSSTTPHEGSNPQVGSQHPRWPPNRPKPACALLQNSRAAPKHSDATMARLFMVKTPQKTQGEGNTTRVLSPRNPNNTVAALPSGLSRRSHRILVEVGVASTPFTHLVLSSPHTEHLRQALQTSHFSRSDSFACPSGPNVATLRDSHGPKHSMAWAGLGR